MQKTGITSQALSTPGIIRALLRNIKKQKDFIGLHLLDQLSAAQSANDGTLHETDFKKIRDYYGLAVPAILGEALCALRSMPMTIQERKTLMYQGAMTGLFDDFFDKDKKSDDEIRAFMETPTLITANSSREKLFLDFYAQALDHVPDRTIMLQWLRRVYAAQMESRKQAIPDLLSSRQINEITIDKGGVSVLFYRAAFADPIGEAEEKALYKIGGLMQFGNDIFDVYKDHQQGIETLVTTAQNINSVRLLFKEAIADSFAALRQTPYPLHNKKKFLRFVLMAICSRCFVCLDQLEKKEKLSGGVFKPALYTRKDLICDMHSWKNKWRSVLYYIKQYEQ